MPEMTCYACDPPTVIPYAGPAAFTPVWRTHCIRVHPNGTTPPDPERRTPCPGSRSTTSSTHT